MSASDQQEQTQPDGRINCSDLAAEVRQAMQQSGYRQLSQIACDTDGSVVLLRGRLKSFHQKQMVISIAANVPGVAKVVDDTVVMR